jgi:hypothetical protein
MRVNIQQIIELANDINNALEVEKDRWRSKIKNEQNERDKMREECAREKEINNELRAENERLKIRIEYWQEKYKERGGIIIDKSDYDPHDIKHQGAEY